MRDLRARVIGACLPASLPRHTPRFGPLYTGPPHEGAYRRQLPAFPTSPPCLHGRFGRAHAFRADGYDGANLSAKAGTARPGAFDKVARLLAALPWRRWMSLPKAQTRWPSLPSPPEFTTRLSTAPPASNRRHKRAHNAQQKGRNLTARWSPAVSRAVCDILPRHCLRGKFAKTWPPPAAWLN